MRKPISLILRGVGFTLWLPGIALFNVGGAWGLQIAMLLGLALFVMMLLMMMTHHEFVRRLNVKKEWLSFYCVALAADVICTVLSRVGVSKSVQTLAAEIFAMAFALGVSWWICRAPQYSLDLLAGFRIGGMVSAFYAIYQVVGWHVGLPLTIVPQNNASFSLMDPWTAQAYGRSLAACPEPSVLASLLLPLLALLTVDVFLYGGMKRYAGWVVACLAFLSTSSQAIVLIPFCLMAVVFFTWLLLPRRRRLRKSDLIGLTLLSVGVLALLFSSDSIIEWLSRLGGGNNVSAKMRFAEVYVALTKFQQSPLVGFGLGSSGIEVDARLQVIAGAHGYISSAFFRILSEQGLAGMAVIGTAAACLYFRWRRVALDWDQAALLAYLFSFVVATTLACLFVGYRNVYHLWLIVPLGLCLKSEWKRLASAKGTVNDLGYVPRGGLAEMEGEVS